MIKRLAGILSFVKATSLGEEKTGIKSSVWVQIFPFARLVALSMLKNQPALQLTIAEYGIDGFMTYQRALVPREMKTKPSNILTRACDFYPTTIPVH